MPNLARAKPRPPARIPPASKTKILLVRQPVKSVRHADQADRTSVRLAIGVIVALGVIGVVWLMGYLGWRLGFAPIMRVPDLHIEGSGGIATGTLMLIGLPRVILEAGIAQPMWLMGAFALICVPAASLGGIKAPVRGGPKLKPAIVAMLYTGAIFAMLNAIGLMWWTVSPFRNQFVTELPYAPANIKDWLDNLRIVGGLDALGVVAAALWVVVAMRLPVPMWLRALASSICLFVLVVITVAFAVTNATITQVTAQRSVFFDDEGSIEPRLIVGTTPDYLVTLHVQSGTALLSPASEEGSVDGEPPVPPDGATAESSSAPRARGRVPEAVIEMSDRPAKLTIIGRESIFDFLNRKMPER